MSEDGDYVILTPRRRRSRREWARSPWTLAFAYGLWALAGAAGAHNFYLRRPIYGGCQLAASVIGFTLLNVGWGMAGGLVLGALCLSLAWDMLAIPKVLLDRQ